MTEHRHRSCFSGRRPSDAKKLQHRTGRQPLPLSKADTSVSQTFALFCPNLGDCEIAGSQPVLYETDRQAARRFLRRANAQHDCYSLSGDDLGVFATTPSQHAASWFENVWNQRNETYLRNNLRVDVTASGSEVRGTGKTTAGPGSSKVIATVDDFVVFWRGLLNAIDPFKIGIKRVTEERDEVSSIAELTGRDIKTGVDVSFHVAFWIRIQDNVIVEAENVVDFHRYLAQVRPDHEHTLRDHLGMDA